MSLYFYSLFDILSFGNDVIANTELNWQSMEVKRKSGRNERNKEIKDRTKEEWKKINTKEKYNRAEREIHY